MKTVYIDWDEMYPRFTHYNDEGYCTDRVDVPEETLERWDKILSDFCDYQQELRKLSSYHNQ